MVLLIESYMDTLITIKHMGALDKISNAFDMLFKKFYQLSNPKYVELPERFLNQIIEALEKDGNLFF